MPKEWDPSEGDVWIRAHIEISDQIEGIEVSGSRVEVYSSVMTSGSEVFIDSGMV